MVASNTYLAKFFLPLIVEQFLSIMTGIADTFIASSLGQDEVSSISLVDQIFVLINILLLSFANGSAILLSHSFGAKDFLQCKKITRRMGFLTSIYTIFLVAILFVFRNFLLDFLFPSVTSEIKELSKPYFLLMIASIPFVALFNCVSAIFKGLGDTKSSMWIALIMNILNILGNFIFTKIFDFGINGIAWSTFASRFFAGLAGVILILIKFQKTSSNKNDNQILAQNSAEQIRPQNLVPAKQIPVPAKQIDKQIISLALPTSIENGLYQLGKLLVITFIAKMGREAIASNAACNVISLIGVLTGFAGSTALQTLTAMSYGEKDFFGMKINIKKCMLFIYASFALINIPIFIFAEQITNLFHYEGETARLTILLVRYHATFCTFFWPTASAFPSVLRSLGDVKFTLAVSTVSMWAIRIGLCYILSFSASLGVLGVWISMSIEWVVKSIAFVTRFFFLQKKSPTK